MSDFWREKKHLPREMLRSPQGGGREEQAVQEVSLGRFLHLPREMQISPQGVGGRSPPPCLIQN